MGKGRYTVARLGLLECFRLAFRSRRQSEVSVNPVSAVFNALHWFRRGVPKQWIDPENPKRARRDLGQWT